MGISLPEEQGPEDSPNVGTLPMLAHDVCRIFLSLGEDNVSLGNCFMDKVEGEHVVPFMQLGLELHCNDLLNTGTISQHLTAASGNLNSGLFLGEPV